MVSDGDELGLLSKARPLIGQALRRSHPNSRWIRLQQNLFCFPTLLFG